MKKKMLGDENSINQCEGNECQRRFEGDILHDRRMV